MEVLNEDCADVASDEDKARITKALVDLTNGNYLGVGQTENMQKIKLQELSSVENAFKEVLKMAKGLNLSEADKNKLITEVVKQANSMNINNYLVHGDMDWQDAKLKEENNKFAAEILGHKADYSRYSLYTIQIARLLKDAYKQTKLSPKAEASINDALKDFVEKYDRHLVESNKE